MHIHNNHCVFCVILVTVRYKRTKSFFCVNCVLTATRTISIGGSLWFGCREKSSFFGVEFRHLDALTASILDVVFHEVEIPSPTNLSIIVIVLYAGWEHFANRSLGGLQKIVFSFLFWGHIVWVEAHLTAIEAFALNYCCDSFANISRPANNNWRLSTQFEGHRHQVFWHRLHNCFMN